MTMRVRAVEDLTQLADPLLFDAIAEGLEWQFPMYDSDLSPIPVDPQLLRERQRNWSLDW
jgi:hypothetical protein